MIVICTQCSMRLQLDDAKVPARPFTVRCPRCQNIISAQPNVENNLGAHALGQSPATEHPRLEQTGTQTVKSDAFTVEGDASEQAATSVTDANDVLRLLTTLLQRGMSVGEKSRDASRLAWERHRVLVCVEPRHRQAVVRKLTEHDYQVSVAENTTQAIERMREDRMDIIILDTEFDAVEQGAAHVSNEINALRPADRRRTFFVHLSATGRTLDQHAAFIGNVNLIVNHADIDTMPRALERGLRDYNDLYRDLNRALNIAAL